MKSSIRLFIVCIIAGLCSLNVFAQSAPKAPANLPLTPPPVATPPVTAAAQPHGVPARPANLEAVVSEAEWRRYVEYQSKVRDNPEVAAINAQLLPLFKQVNALQEKLKVARSNAVASDPEGKAIAAKVEKAILSVQAQKK